ncbi:MAG: hypothetical protein KC415_05805 [Anaerolineales bacterium]|nr:hypothetical protein [Anaerolineales bacterium]
MKGDFSRVTFDQTKHFSQVLMQQGRVQLDADWNEQAAILLHYMRTLAADLIGPHGGPEDHGGFAICKTEAKFEEETQEKLSDLELSLPPDGDFLITKGRYYVDGLLCENEEHIFFTKQPDWQPDELRSRDYPCLLYLDVWERLITYIEDDAIREVALDGPDTAVRSQLVWQVKAKKGIGTCDQATWDNLVRTWQPENRGLLKAQAQIPEGTDELEPCTITPDARYRGAENQLYRVEIHRSSTDSPATFKSSCENGSVVVPITAISGKLVTVENLGRFKLQKDDWVEIVDDDYILAGRAEPLHQVDSIDPMIGQVKLKTEPTIAIDVKKKHPLLRRWDHKAGNAEKGGLTPHNDGSVLIEESSSKWLKLEDGIEIQFQPGGTYLTGDYWLIPARTITGDVEWPRDGNGNPVAIPPHGVEHHYAPLAIVTSADADPENCRHQFKRMLAAEDETG